MAFVFTPSPSPSSGRRLGLRRRAVEWRVVGYTAVGAVMFIAMLARPF